MRLRYDKDSDALYFRLEETAIKESEEVSPGVILDFNENDEVIGIEMLDISKRSSPESLKVLHYEKD